MVVAGETFPQSHPVNFKFNREEVLIGISNLDLGTHKNVILNIFKKNLRNLECVGLAKCICKNTYLYAMKKMDNNLILFSPYTNK